MVLFLLSVVLYLLIGILCVFGWYYLEGRRGEWIYGEDFGRMENLYFGLIWPIAMFCYASDPIVNKIASLTSKLTFRVNFFFYSLGKRKYEEKRAKESVVP